MQNELQIRLTPRNILLQGLIYNNQSIACVYIGTCQGQPVAIKTVIAPSESDYAAVEREYQTLLHITHPNVLRMLDCFWEQVSGKWVLVIITELCRQDLGKYIKDRAKTGQYWSEAEAWELLRTLVAAFAYMQTHGFAHRDIKVENIFLTAEGIVKVGDFGSSRYIATAHIQATLAGSPLYLSPVLKATYLSRQISASHDVYKSDVYSLGVTMLYVLSLKAPLTLMEARDPDQEVYTILQTCPWYSDVLKSVIRWMMTADENQRCDFSQLHAYFNPQEQLVYPPEQPAKQLVYPPDQPAEQLAYPSLERAEMPGTTAPKAVPLQSDSAASLRAEGRAVVKCLGCQQDFERSGLQEPVQLYCNASDHIFCTLDCFRKFLKDNEGNEVCPKCNEPIHPELKGFKTVGWGEWILKKIPFVNR
jgi:NIMA (never in mitosis gene a)-related kinase